jgi:hypothetical protein
MKEERKLYRSLEQNLNTRTQETNILGKSLQIRINSNTSFHSNHLIYAPFHLYYISYPKCSFPYTHFQVIFFKWILLPSHSLQQISNLFQKIPTHDRDLLEQRSNISCKKLAD